MDVEVKQLIEETGKTVATMQASMTRLEEDGKSNSDGLKELKENFEKLTGQIDDVNAKAEAAEEDRKRLEVIMARGGKTDGEKHAGTDEYREAFGNFIRTKSTVSIDLQEGELKELAAALDIKDEKAYMELKTALIGSNPDGGYLVPVDVRSEIVKRMYELSPMRRAATVITTARDKVAYPIDDDMAINAAWASELDARNESDTPQLGVEDFLVHTLYAQPKATVEMLEDATINVEGWLRDKVSQYFARKEATAFMTGDGAKKPRGFLDYDETGVELYKRGAIGTKETAANDTYTADDIIKFQYNLLEDYQANASWMVNRQTFGGIATLKTTNGDYLLNPRILFEGAQLQMLGKNVLFAPDMAAVPNPAAATDGAKILAYGDFREGYLIVDRLGITILRNPYKDPRFVQFEARKRVGGGVKNFQAIKVLKVQ